jgi:hypothetical protein
MHVSDDFNRFQVISIGYANAPKYLKIPMYGNVWLVDPFPSSKVNKRQEFPVSKVGRPQNVTDN